jgi:beta-galactosidase
MEHKVLDDGRIEVMLKQELLGGEAELTYWYRLDGEGVLELESAFRPLSTDRKMLMKIGHHWTLPLSMENLQWYGRGPFESYEDRKYAAHLGLYEGKIADQYHPYIRPQESGNKTDVRRAAVYDREGRGLEILALDQAYQLNVLPYSPQQLYSGPRKGQENSGLLESDKFVHLHIDHRQMGVGGINSWGTLPLESYRVPVQKYSYRYLIRPLR